MASNNKLGNFDTLVLSGGSINSIIMLGSLQYASDNYLLSHINIYIGTSAGSICCYLLAIGYTPVEIIVYMCTKQILEKMKHFSLLGALKGEGATTFTYIHESLEKMTIDKIGRLITLKELNTLYNKTLVCITHNFTSNRI